VDDGLDVVIDVANGHHIPEFLLANNANERSVHKILPLASRSKRIHNKYILASGGIERCQHAASDEACPASKDDHCVSWI
jgi:hypothetical protein